MIVATAGHVDHGKTTLVAALTGVDTDRLPEEKKRGISIDLGFAYMPTPYGDLIGFVDVPGHERFVHNMIAGIAAIDLGLLVVAADDGVMPQTREHVDILELLAVPRGIVAITKIDRVEPERVAQVEAEIRTLLAERNWLAAAIIPISAAHNIGMETLRAALLEQHLGAQSNEVRVGNGFRFIVDRTFVAAGSGTVVTGTAVSGTVTPGETITVSPAGIQARVRGIQQNHMTAAAARPGRRYALNLTGIDRHHVRRGEWLLSTHLHAPTDRIDVAIRLAHDYLEALQHWTPVHFHSGASDLLARLVLTKRESVGPGQTAFGQLLLQKPIAACTGDRFVLRDQSARATIAGGVVIDPFAAVRRRGREFLPQLQALASGGLETAFEKLLECSADGVDVERFGKRFALSEAQLQQLVNRPDVAVIRSNILLAFRKQGIEELTSRILAAVAGYHERCPHEPGIPQPELHRASRCPFDLALFNALLRKLADRGAIEMTRERVGLPSFRPTRRADAMSFLKVIRPELVASGLGGISLTKIAELARLSPDAVNQCLAHLVGRSELYRFKEDRYLAKASVDDLVGKVHAVAQAHDGVFTAAQFRDHTGIGRNLTIELLEFLDRRGITFRVGNVRHLREAVESMTAKGNTKTHAS